MDSYQKQQAFVISAKTLFLIYISFAWLLAYENLVIGDSNWGQIYTAIVSFAVPYLIIDYFIAILRFGGVITDKKFGGIFILDLLIDQAPKFFTKKGFVPDKRGYVLAIIIGFVLFLYFFSNTQTTGNQYSGLPSFTGQLTPLDKPTKAALVAPFEDLGSTTLTSIIGVVIYGIYYFVSRKKETAKKSTAVIFIALLIGSYGSALYMSDLHEKVYSLDKNALNSITEFFFVGNIVSSITGSQYSFDVLHSQWNYNVLKSSACLGTGCH